MEKNVYHDMVKLQEEHWWFKARKEIVYEQLKSIASKPNPKILEIGCGTGGNLQMLSKIGDVYGMEMNEYAVQYIRENTSHNILQGSLPEDIPYKNRFDLICMLDVLEHIENDDLAISSILPLLKPDGRLILTVPAYQWLFGKHDKKLHHFRRYNKKSLRKLFQIMELKTERLSYFNTFLFPLAVVARILDRYNNSKESTGYSTPPKPLNFILYSIFRIEKFLLQYSRLPFGCSIMIVGCLKEKQ